MHARQFLLKILGGIQTVKEHNFSVLSPCLHYLDEGRGETKISRNGDEEKDTNIQFTQQNPSEEWNRGRFIQM